ncbi:MAG: site-specific DNA-methyltransferase [Planctomycetes bacterium]|nr:site-specific DNA-methyltransferase [Planctomycetota bacterium]
MINNPLPRLDVDSPVRAGLLSYCRLRPGEIWTDPQGRHRVGCLDAADAGQVADLLGAEKAQLAIQDPPYNVAAFEDRELPDYLEWNRRWVENTLRHLAEHASLYVWLGADQSRGFQPLPDFMLLMRARKELEARSFITLRNQRGYGTQKNWMAVRQELLYYVKGRPPFHVQYTNQPKTLRGYYKKVKGKLTENLERSRSPNLRPGNVWTDIQQVFYRLEENVSGCYAQKPLLAMDRIVLASSDPGTVLVDFFGHSGTTLLSCERHGRRCFTGEIDPIFCEICIRRLERYRALGLLGWQNSHPFEAELGPVEPASYSKR